MLRPAAFLAIALCLSATGLSAEQRSARLEEARELVDRGELLAALPILDTLAETEPRNAEVFLLRSTVRFLWGDIEAGRADLDRTLELDPQLRQAWLNRGGLLVSEGQFNAAIEAFETAQRLDPSASDNAINLGAVRLLSGDLSAAAASFQKYLASQSSNSEAYYLVATNYAMAGFSALAAQHLQQAVQLDERIRVRVRADANFRDMWQHDDFQRLMNTDVFPPTPGSHQAMQELDALYAAGNGPLLEIVLDALQQLAMPFDKAVEVTPNWALIWGEMRIKLRDVGDSHGVVELSSSADRFTPAVFSERSEILFREIVKQAQKRRWREQHAAPTSP